MDDGDGVGGPMEHLALHRYATTYGPRGTLLWNAAMECQFAQAVSGQKGELDPTKSIRKLKNPELFGYCFVDPFIIKMCYIFRIDFAVGLTRTFFFLSIWLFQLRYLIIAVSEFTGGSLVLSLSLLLNSFVFRQPGRWCLCSANICLCAKVNVVAYSLGVPIVRKVCQVRHF